MKGLKIALIGISIVSFLFIGLTPLLAQSSYTLKPWIYDPDNTKGVVSSIIDDSLRLEKNVPTTTNASAGAVIKGVEGISTDDLTLGFTVEDGGYCGAGAPRFNLYLDNGDIIFLGCAHGNDGTGLVSFMPGESYGGQEIPMGETVQRLDLVLDENGQTTLSSIMVNGEEVRLMNNRQAAVRVACKNNNWRNYEGNPFRNQGQCVSYFNRTSVSPTTTAQ